MKEFEVYTEKAPVKIFGDMVSIYYRIFHISELDKHILELEIDDYHSKLFCPPMNRIRKIIQMILRFIVINLIVLKMKNFIF